MIFFPFQPLEEFTEIEKIARAKFLYEKNPTKEYTEEWIKAIELEKKLFGSLPKREKVNNREYAESRAESEYFPDGYHIAVLRHPRFMEAGWHAHDFFEMIYVYSGECTHYIDEREISMSKGDLCVLPPNMPHGLYTDQEESLVVNILIRKSTFDQMFFQLFTEYSVLREFFTHTLYQKNNNAYLLFETKEDEKLRKMVHAMYDEYRSKETYSSSILTGQITQLLGYLMRHHGNSIYQLDNSRSKKSVNVAAVLNYIHQNLKEVTLTDLARTFAYSDSALSRIIKEATGKNFREILREEKVRRAEYLLKNSELSLNEIMERTGYADMSQFYKNFQRIYGMTPAQYRKRKVNAMPE